MTYTEVASPIAEIIRERRSIKTGYTEEEVSKELIVSLLEDAVWAPNHKLREPWRFIFVGSERREAFINAILTCYPRTQHEVMRNKFVDVPAFLIVIMQEEPRQKQWDENFAATSSLIQNLQLLAWDKNLGMVWKTPEHIYDPQFHAELGVERGEKIVSILQIGYFDENAKKVPRNRTPATEKLTFF